ncbi:hypothetical protein E2C01_046229 [Portunus trituberculatus]|uniref:Uncharacterized protein n=1 Tax=Portunus trituberculatus TaxID=210409 RepID=A0A5B7FXW6_PORTR|nr:hypothetical protein [Portunus trituberculatus]
MYDKCMGNPDEILSSRGRCKEDSIPVHTITEHYFLIDGGFYFVQPLQSRVHPAAAAGHHRDASSNMGLSLKILKNGSSAGDKCAARKYSLEEEENGGMETKHTAAKTGDHQTLDGYVDHLQYLRPVLCCLRNTGMLTWLEQDVRDTTYARRWKLLLLVGFLRFLHAGVVFIFIFFMVYHENPRDIAGIVAHAINLVLPLTSFYFLIVICYKSQTLAHLCRKLVDLDFFFIKWQHGNPSSQAMKMRRPKILVTDPIAILLTLLFFLSLLYQFFMHLELSLTKIMIGLPIVVVTNIVSASMLLVILLYRVVTRLLGYEMRRFLLAAVEGTTLFRIRNRSMMSGINETGDLLLTFFTHERSEVSVHVHGENKEEERGEVEPCPKVYILGEAFFRADRIDLTLNTLQLRVSCVSLIAHPVFLDEYRWCCKATTQTNNTTDTSWTRISQCSKMRGRFDTPYLINVFNRVRLEDHSLTFSRRQLGVVREALNRIPDFRVSGLFSLGNKVFLSVSIPSCRV